MNKWVYVQPNGQVVYTTSFNDDSVTPEIPPGGSFFVRVDHDAEDAVLMNSWYDNETNTFTPLPPKPDDGFYLWDSVTRAWVPDIDLTTRDVLRKRQIMLGQSDYTQLPDTPVADKELWAVYRQALRDITEQPGYPLQINWPTAPGQE